MIKKLNRKIEKAYDIINSSPTKSNSNVIELEDEIRIKTEYLETDLIDNNLIEANIMIDKIIKLSNQRNEILKKYK